MGSPLTLANLMTVGRVPVPHLPKVCPFLLGPQRGVNGPTGDGIIPTFQIRRPRLRNLREFGVEVPAVIGRAGR